MVPPFVLGGADVAERRVALARSVERLDDVDDGHAGLSAGAPARAGDQLAFEGGDVDDARVLGASTASLPRFRREPGSYSLPTPALTRAIREYISFVSRVETCARGGCICSRVYWFRRA
jgi:hypothetical protein